MTLPSPVDLARFVPRDKAASRAQLGEPSPDDKWILFTALNTADPIKRFRLAQEAFARASARRGGLRFRVASTLAHDDVPLFVAACDLILCTSETEGWPNSVKEALACDVPFVSTDVSDLAAIALVEPACRVCPPDAEALATAMCEVLAMPAPAGLRRHVASMDLDASTAQLIRFYESILAGAPALKAVS